MSFGTHFNESELKLGLLSVVAELALSSVKLWLLYFDIRESKLLSRNVEHFV